MSLIIYTFIAFGIFFIWHTYNILIENKQKTALPPYDQPKPLIMKVGEVITLPTVHEAVDIFYAKDDRYVLLVPRIHNMYLSHPSVVKLDVPLTDKSIITDRDILLKTMDNFNQFKETHKDKFLY
jgi:hypothetical protein